MTVQRCSRVILLSVGALLSVPAGIAVAGPNGGTVVGGSACYPRARAPALGHHQPGQPERYHRTGRRSISDQGQTTTFNQTQ